MASSSSSSFSPDQILSASISKLTLQTYHPQQLSLQTYHPQQLSLQTYHRQQLTLQAYHPQPPTTSTMNFAPSTTPNTSPLNPNPTQNTQYTITNPITFTTYLDQHPPTKTSSITHLTLAPSPHLGRITSLPRLNDTLGDSLGDASTFAELHSWVTLLQRLSHSTPSLRSLTIIFDADMSGRDTHGYRRGVGECLGFIWAIARFRGLEWVDLQGYFPAQWPWYLRGVWNASGQATKIYNRVEAPEWELRVWRRGTERLDPREFGWE